MASGDPYQDQGYDPNDPFGFGQADLPQMPPPAAENFAAGPPPDFMAGLAPSPSAAAELAPPDAAAQPFDSYAELRRRVPAAANAYPEPKKPKLMSEIVAGLADVMAAISQAKRGQSSAATGGHLGYVLGKYQGEKTLAKESSRQAAAHEQALHEQMTAHDIQNETAALGAKAQTPIQRTYEFLVKNEHKNGGTMEDGTAQSYLHHVLTGGRWNDVDKLSWYIKLSPEEKTAYKDMNQAGSGAKPEKSLEERVKEAEALAKARSQGTTAGRPDKGPGSTEGLSPDQARVVRALEGKSSRLIRLRSQAEQAMGDALDDNEAATLEAQVNTYDDLISNNEAEIDNILASKLVPGKAGPSAADTGPPPHADEAELNPKNSSPERLGALKRAAPAHFEHYRQLYPGDPNLRAVP